MQDCTSITLSLTHSIPNQDIQQNNSNKATLSIAGKGCDWKRLDTRIVESLKEVLLQKHSAELSKNRLRNLLTFGWVNVNNHISIRNLEPLHWNGDRNKEEKNPHQAEEKESLKKVKAAKVY